VDTTYEPYVIAAGALFDLLTLVRVWRATQDTHCNPGTFSLPLPSPLSASGFAAIPAVAEIY
jgi:hypothetical protein